MVKKSNKKNKKKGAGRPSPQKERKRASQGVTRARRSDFGPLTRINTAPVAIGNTIRGIEGVVMQAGKDMVRVKGRDFALQAAATGSITGWVNVGGFPLTPAAFVSSILRSYSQIYNKFKFNYCAVHYITSSATSSTGDVMFQVNRSRSDPCANNTASTFLSYVMSEPNTIIGPQWTNHSIIVNPAGPFRDMNPGMNSDIDYAAQGEVFLYSKTTTVDAPGYLIFDYDITFKELSVHPRAGLFPNPMLIFQPIQLIMLNQAYVAATTTLFFTTGTRWIGNTAITALTAQANFRIGDVYKLSLDITNTVMSTYTVTAGAAATAATLLDTAYSNTTTLANTVVDGWTTYAVFYSNTSCQLYQNPASAFASTRSAGHVAGFTGTVPAYGEAAGVPNAGGWLYGVASWCGNVNPAFSQQQ